MYFNAILNIPIAASPDRRTIAFATLGAVRGTTIAPVQPLPSYEPREDRNCADDNGNGIPNFIEELSKSLDEVRHMMLEPY